MKKRKLTVILSIESTATMRRIAEKVICNLACRTDSPAVCRVNKVKVTRREAVERRIAQ